MSERAAAVRRRGLEQWAGLGGAVYVVLFIIALIFAQGGQPDTDSSPAKLRAYWGDSSHRDRVGVGWALGVLALFFFLWFLSSLRLTLRRLDGDGVLTMLATIGGVVYAALALAAMAVNMGIKTMSDDTYQHTVYPELIHAADDTAYILHASGGIGAGAMMIAASVVAMRVAAIPRWLGWIGTIAGVLALASILFFPQFLIALWLLVAGILLFLRRAEPAVTAV